MGIMVQVCQEVAIVIVCHCNVKIVQYGIIISMAQYCQENMVLWYHKY